MPVSYADAENAWQEAEREVSEWKAKMMLEWYAPILRMGIGFAVGAMPPEALEKLDKDKLIAVMEEGG